MIKVFTNGCFEILHPGHIHILNEAKELGDKLIVGVNSDKSFEINKKRKPFFNQEERKNTLLNLKSVNEVFIFNEETPYNLIKELKPNILVKGSDWANNVIGSDLVKKVVIIQRLPEYSTTNVIESIRFFNEYDPQIADHMRMVNSLHDKMDKIITSVKWMAHVFSNGGKILICGNGGSAADAQHLAAELVGIGLPAISLTTDTSVLTALGNDFSFDEVFAKQLSAQAKRGDLLIAISTSGKSINIIRTILSAKQKECTVIGMTGKVVPKLFQQLCDFVISIDSINTQRIQEGHELVYHIWYDYFKKEIDK
jgi:D-sedoheptulose 7-phosphate isomerase